MSEATNKRRRVMGELIFVDGRKEAEAIGAELRAAGFEFSITEDNDEPGLAFAMVWKDYDADVDRRVWAEFSAALGAILSRPTFSNLDCVGFVEPGHVPTRFGDYGESAVVAELNRWARIH